MFVCRVVFPHTTENTLLNRLSDQQQVGDDGYRYVLRATMGWFRGVGIERNTRTGTVATIAYCASDRIAKGSIYSYLELQYCLKVTLNRLSYKQYLCIASY